MGGPSSSFQPAKKGELDRLEQLARKSLADGSKEGRKNVFISFAGEDLNAVNLLRAQAKNEKSDIEFNDWSLPEPFDSKRAEYIKRGIRERIQRSSVTVVFVSEHTAASKWVDWEIRESLRLQKGVIAMYSGDSPPSTLPKAYEENRGKIELVKWTVAGIADAIENAGRDRG